MNRRSIILIIGLSLMISQISFAQDTTSKKRIASKSRQISSMKECVKTECDHKKGKPCLKNKNTGKKKCCKGEKCPGPDVKSSVKDTTVKREVGLKKYNHNR